MILRFDFHYLGDGTMITAKCRERPEISVRARNKDILALRLRDRIEADIRLNGERVCAFELGNPWAASARMAFFVIAYSQLKAAV
jgi:hypothetical protein